MTRRRKQETEQLEKVRPKFDFMVKYQLQKAEYDKTIVRDLKTDEEDHGLICHQLKKYLIKRSS